MLVHAVEASEVRRREVLEDLEIQFVRKVGETRHLASGELRVDGRGEGGAKGGVLGKRCQRSGSLCSYWRVRRMRSEKIRSGRTFADLTAVKGGHNGAVECSTAKGDE